MRTIYKLDDFYQTKTWIKLTKIIRQERINNQGEIICEFCKKPIVKSYDCICHHKIELTEDNVNDFNISLNKENIELVHHRCHNLIHEKFKKPHQNVYIVYGSPLSGKNTFVKNNMLKGDLVVDLDLIWQSITMQDKYTKPYQVKQFVFKIRDLLIDGIKYRLGDWTNAYIIGGYPFKTDRERLIKELNAKEVFMECTKEECYERLINDKEREFESYKKHIDKWFEDYY